LRAAVIDQKNRAVFQPIINNAKTNCGFLTRVLPPRMTPVTFALSFDWLIVLVVSVAIGQHGYSMVLALLR